MRECFGFNKIIKRVKQSGIASGIVPDRKKSCKLTRLLTLELILYGGLHKNNFRRTFSTS